MLEQRKFQGGAKGLKVGGGAIQVRMRRYATLNPESLANYSKKISSSDSALRASWAIRETSTDMESERKESREAEDKTPFYGRNKVR